MTRGRRRLLWGLGAAFLVVFWALGALRLWLGSSVPSLGGRESVPGITDSVVVFRDSLGVPHIVARTDDDLFASLGYLHARDRMWEMDLMRHLAEGRVSELVGSRAVGLDRTYRALEMKRIARAKLAVTGPEARRAVEAYARGVNAWLSRDQRAPEFRLVGHTPEPWTPVNSIEIGVVEAWDLHTSGAELAMARAVARLGPEKARDLAPSYPDSAPVIVGAGGRLETGHLAGRPAPVVSRFSAPGPRLPSPDLDGRGDASNSWVIGPAKTASGKPILANDPHLVLRAPSIWYLAALHAPGFDVVGATIPGIPAVVLGHNARVAWGFTNGMVDDVDFVIEQLDRDSTHVRTPSGWAPVDVVAETIQVKGAAPVVYRRLRTPDGPVVNGEWRPDSGRVLALRWVAQTPSDELSALLAMDRASTEADFEAAVPLFRSPEQNIVFADAGGDIAYYLGGRVPVRRKGNGGLPTPGWTGEGAWERFLSDAELPRMRNPRAGFIVTANNRIEGNRFPFFISSDWELPYRAQRILEMVAPESSATAAGEARHQLDVTSVFARATAPLAARAAESLGRVDVANELRRWDARFALDRTEPTIFWSWYRELEHLTFDDQYPDWEPSAPFHHWLAVGASPWFDDARTPQHEDLASLARQAMAHVLARSAAPRWGAVNTLTEDHPLGAVPFLGWFAGFNIGPFPAEGGSWTVNVCPSDERTPPFACTEGPSLRHVVDLGNVDGDGGFILPAGESGHPLSPHYRDQAARWRRGELWILPVDVRKVAATDTLRLVPLPH